MKLYSITVSVGEDGYDVNIINSNVISYERNSICKVERFGYTSEFPSSKLDEYKIGLLSGKVPSISIDTIGKEFVDTYIEKMKQMIKDELVERLNRTQNQLDVIEN